MDWLWQIVSPALAAVAVIIAAWFGLRGKRRETDVAAQSATDAALAARFDDASQLAQYIREEVERQVAPIREELKGVKEESHEMHNAVRTRESQLWLWDQRGRQGELPMLPNPILVRLGLGHLTDDWPTEPSKT